MEGAYVECRRIWPSTRAGWYRLLSQALAPEAPTPAIDGPPDEAYQRIPMPKKGGRGMLVLDNADALHAIDPELVRELPILSSRLPYHIVLNGEADPLAAVATQRIDLAPFLAATSADFLRRRFAAAGLHVDEEPLRVFYEFTRGAPHALQLLADATWRLTRDAGTRDVRVEHVEQGVLELVDRLPTDVVGAWSALRGTMRDIFVAMCLFDLESPTEIARRLGLEPKAAVVLLARLSYHHRLVERFGRGAYRVRDPLLKHYVRKEWASPVVRPPARA